MHAAADDQHPPFVLIPSFDGSLLEFRRLYPLLSAARETWTLDLAGWGFTDCGFAEDPTQELGPEQKRSHLLAFWQEKVGGFLGAIACSVCLT